MITYRWINPLIEYTQTNSLTIEDIGELDQNNKISTNTNLLMDTWNKISSTSTKYPLAYSLLICYKWQILFMLLLKWVSTIVININIYFTKQILEYIEGDSDNTNRAVFFVFVLVSFEIIYKVINRNCLMIQEVITSRVSYSVTGLVYSKLFRFSKSIHKYTKGELNNLCVNDTGEIESLIWQMPYWTSNVLSIAIGCYALYHMIGFIFIIGLGIIGLTSGFLYFCSHLQSKIYELLSSNNDDRVNLLTEIIENIKVIKINSWINCFTNKFESMRKDRYKHIVYSYLVDVPESLVSSCGYTLLIVGVFCVCVLGYSMAMSIATTVIIIRVFENIKNALVELPFMLNNFQKCKANFAKIERFLNCDDEEIHLFNRTNQDCEIAVSIKNSNFFWGFDKHIEMDDSDEPPNSDIQIPIFKTLEERITLKDINLTIKNGEFIAVIGEVGSGKSSLLSAILGQMLYIDNSTISHYKDTSFYLHLNGEENQQLISDFNMMRKQHSLNAGERICINGRISLVEQRPFILNKTIRDNILFGEELNNQKYNKIVQICQLGRDFQVLDGGDLTEIGERGINLSGGQKARVSIARAVYANADILLMDDPLSALDAHVKRKIFDDVCLKELANKTRILVTHSIEFLDRVDRVIVMDKGKIILNGTFKEISNHEYFKNIASSINKMHENISDSVSDKSDSEKKEEIEDYISLTGKKIIEDDDSKEIPENNLTSYINYFKYLKKAVIVILISIIVIALERAVEMENEYSIVSWVKEFSKNKEINYSGIIFIFAISFSKIIFELLEKVCEVVQNYFIEKDMFTDMFQSIMNASIPLFYDKTHSGKIMNRFNKDLPISSNYIADALKGCIYSFWAIIMTLSFVSYHAPICLAIIPISVVLLCYILNQYSKTLKKMKHLKNNLYNPILTFINESIDGITTIRSYNKSAMFFERYSEMRDQSFNVNIIESGVCSWLDIRINLISLIFVGFTYYYCIYMKERSDPIIIGLMIKYLINMQNQLNNIVHELCWVDINMISFDRCMKLCQVPQEAQQRLSLPNDENNLQWMSQGSIKFKDLCIRYRPDTEIVLQNITFDINAKEKIGILGRTGAGKSTICLALCRVLEATNGSIQIDGVDISTLGVSDLREQITIIPQDPILFNNTLRFNLDPESLRTDEEIIKILNKACLNNLLTRDDHNLDFKITEKGSNLSAGEKSLICICRAILRKNKIVILDEATASIDINTEQIIQRLILEEFKDSTVITIAHRLNTIMHCDKIAIFCFGKLIEFDNLQTLKSNPNSEFSDFLFQFKL